MEKPKNYDEVQAFADGSVQLPPGGYICKIVKVEESESQNKKALVKIALDIAEGEYKDFYRTKFNNDTRTDKKWGCVVYQLILDNDGNANRGFKTFNTSVEESNTGFTTVWGNDYCKALKGKLIGGIFRREQFETADGKKAFSTKCYMFRSVETIRKGVEVPEDKLLDTNSSSNNNTKPYKVEQSVDDDDLPF